jgi:hypothetical protein
MSIPKQIGRFRRTIAQEVLAFVLEPQIAGSSVPRRALWSAKYAH